MFLFVGLLSTAISLLTPQPTFSRALPAAVPVQSAPVDPGFSRALPA